jgi:outer membrane protein insertion porin family
MRVARVGAAVMLLILGSAPQSPAQIAPSPYPARTLIVDVRVLGTETTTEDFVRSQLRTRKDREFDAELVQADVRRLASTGRFEDVRTFTQETPEGGIITFQVFERPTIHYIRFLGNRGLSDKALSKNMGLKVGDPLNRYAVEEARRKIEELYHSKGFSKAQVLIQEGDQPQDRGAVFAVNEGDLERILDVNFIGNTIVTGSRLKTQIKSKPGWFYVFGGKVDMSTIEQDIQRLTAYYRSLGYFSARIGRELDFSESGKWLTINFVIDEGPRYVVRNVAIVGNQNFATPALLERLELRSGEYFNLAEMSADVNSLQDIYGGQGYIFADIQADPRFLEEPGQLDLVYNIDEGKPWRVGRIHVHIEGEHPHTRQSVVLNRLSLRPGDLIDTREVRASERRIKASQLFSNDPTQGPTPQVRVRPPELQETIETIAERESPAPRAYRGQEPEGP